MSPHQEVRRKLDELRKKKSVTARELLPLLDMLLDAMSSPKPPPRPGAFIRRLQHIDETPRHRDDNEAEGGHPEKGVVR